MAALQRRLLARWCCSLPDAPFAVARGATAEGCRGTIARCEGVAVARASFFAEGRRRRASGASGGRKVCRSMAPTARPREVDARRQVCARTRPRPSNESTENQPAYLCSQVLKRTPRSRTAPRAVFAAQVRSPPACTTVFLRAYRHQAAEWCRLHGFSDTAAHGRCVQPATVALPAFAAVRAGRPVSRLFTW